MPRTSSSGEKSCRRSAALVVSDDLVLKTWSGISGMVLGDLDLLMEISSNEHGLGILLCSIL